MRGGLSGAASIEWDKPVVEGKLGPKHRKAKLNRGEGKLFKKPAEFWAIRPEGTGVLMEGGLAEGASEELLAAMQSVEEK